MDTFYAILEGLFYVVMAAFLTWIFISAMRHTGPDERNARTRYNQTKR